MEMFLIIMSYLIALALTLNAKQHHTRQHIQHWLTQVSIYFCNGFATTLHELDQQWIHTFITWQMHDRKPINLRVWTARPYVESVSQRIQDAFETDIWYLFTVLRMCFLPCCCLCDGIPPRKWTAINDSTNIRGKFCSWSRCFVKKMLVLIQQKRNLFSVCFRGFHCSSDASTSRRAGRGRGLRGALLLDESRWRRG